MPNQLPYSNFHELNLDWILDKLKELEKKVDDFTGSAVPSDNTPLMDSTSGAIGTQVSYARGDHSHPTDTSRASQDDLDTLAGDVNDLDTTLNNAINAVDAKIDFSTASPAMDGLPNPGSSAKLARADHVHPTDTSRASQTQVDSLQAQMDAYAGSANPSDSTPQMDGVGSAGTGGNYARGDHQHPSDSSKLNAAGGTVTGNLTIEGYLTQEKRTATVATDSIGWLRAVKVPYVAGNMVDIYLSRRGSLTPAELHQLRLVINNNVTFRDEVSDSSDTIIDKIRYTDAGYVDIHIDQTYASNLTVDVVPYSATTPLAIELSSLEAVDAAPAGETILATYDFHDVGVYEDSVNAGDFNGAGISMGTLPHGSATAIPYENYEKSLLVLTSTDNAHQAVCLVTCSSSGVVNRMNVTTTGGSSLTFTTNSNQLVVQPATKDVKYLKISF